MKFSQNSLNDICYLITDGKHGDCRNEDNSGYYFISAKDVYEGKMHYEEARQITKDDFAETHRRTNLKPRDILLTNSGTIGRLAIAPDDEKTLNTTFQKSVAILKPIQEKVVPEFLYYSLMHNNRSLVNTASGSAQKNLLLGELKKFTIAIPNIECQEAIVSILSAYDDLIENNLKRIKLLEEAAQLLYRQWFVDFKFPGHEKTKFINGIPEGWEKTNAYEVMNIMSGGTPKTTTPDFWDGEIPFFTPKDYNNSFYVWETEKHLTQSGLSKCNSKLYPKNTTFITARGTVGNITLAQRDMAMNQSCYAVSPKESLAPYYLFLSMREAVNHILGVAKDGVFSNIIVDTFKIIPCIKPLKEVINSFEVKVALYIENIDRISSMNRKLKEARDILLPRLMDGSIEV